MSCASGPLKERGMMRGVSTADMAATCPFKNGFSEAMRFAAPHINRRQSPLPLEPGSQTQYA